MFRVLILIAVTLGTDQPGDKVSGLQALLVRQQPLIVSNPAGFDSLMLVRGQMLMTVNGETLTVRPVITASELAFRAIFPDGQERAITLAESERGIISATFDLPGQTTRVSHLLIPPDESGAINHVVTPGPGSITDTCVCTERHNDCTGNNGAKCTRGDACGGNGKCYWDSQCPMTLLPLPMVGGYCFLMRRKYHR